MLHRISIMSVVFAIVGLCFLAVASGIQLSGNHPGQALEVFVLGIGAFVAAAISLARASKYALSATESGIELSDINLTVPWSDFSSLAHGRFACDPDVVPWNSKKRIQLRLSNQTIALTGKESETPKELYARVTDMFVQNYESRLQGPMKKRYLALVEKYSPSQVVAAVATAPRMQRTKIRGRVVLAGLVWAIFGVVAASLPQANGVGAVVATIGFILSAALFVVWIRDNGRYRDRNDWDQGIIISPDGIALRTKQLTGEMSWDELVSMELSPKPTRPSRLKIRLAGVDVLLNEEFDLPLWYLEKRSTAAMLDGRKSSVATASQTAQPQPPRQQSDNPYAPPQSH